MYLYSYDFNTQLYDRGNTKRKIITQKFQLETEFAIWKSRGNQRKVKQKKTIRIKDSRDKKQKERHRNFIEKI